jgi:integrase
MASIYRHGKGWRVQVYVNGVRDSAVRPTKQEAAAWALEREAQLSGKRLPDKTLGDAFKRYAEEVAPHKGGARWELVRLRSLQDDSISRRPMAHLTPTDIADWRDKRLKAVSPSTVLREMTLIRSVIEVARRDWGWIRDNPMREVRKPKEPPSRKRRVSDAEIDAVKLATGLGEGYSADTAMQRTGLAFLFAIETACRSGEMVAMEPKDVHLKQRFVRLPKTKNGEARDVPLSSKAVEILQILMARKAPTVFDLHGPTRDAMFRRARDAAEIHDLHFHDSRAEAIWRLSKKFNVLELARIIGHKDLKSLMLYYNESAADLAKRLD